MGDVMSDTLPNTPVKDSTDTLLWLGALVVAGVGISWLVMTRPWTSEPSTVTTPPSVSQPSSRASGLHRDQGVGRDAASALNNPLRMARLALDAGMLIEPDDYSAWSLFSRVLADEPEHAEALDGLNDVAEILAERGTAALEQGRVDDAQTIVDRVREAEVVLLTRKSFFLSNSCFWSYVFCISLVILSCSSGEEKP